MWRVTGDDLNMSTLPTSPAFGTISRAASPHAHIFVSSESQDQTDEQLQDMDVRARWRALLPRPVGGWFVADNIEHIVTDLTKVSEETLTRAREATHAALEDARAWTRAERKRIHCPPRAQEILSAPSIRKKGRPVGGVKGEGGRVRARRSDAGTRRAGTKAAPTLPPFTPPTSPRTLPNGGRTKLRAAYIPEGLFERLPLYPDEPLFGAAVLDLAHMLSIPLLARRHKSGGEDYTRLQGEIMRELYRRPKGVWAWNRVCEDAVLAGLVEYERGAEGGKRYCAKKEGGTGYAESGLSMGYRLTAEWRDKPIVRVRRGPELQVPLRKRDAPVRQDGSKIEVPAWALECLDRVEFDLEGAVRYLLTRAGATIPPHLDVTDLEALEALVRAGEPTAETLANVEARRKKPRPKVWSRPRKPRTGKTRTDPRTALEILRDQVLSDLVHLHRWRVEEEGAFAPFRDTAGERLHSPVTGLSSKLRQFMTLDGEALMCVDAANSQMVFVAEAAYRACPTADALEFWNICGDGRFYEVSYEVVHGRAPTAEERNAWKAQIMKLWLFAHGSVQVDSTAGRALSQKWPFVHIWMLSEKLTGNRELPCSCQRREAQVWIDTIVPRLAAAKISCLTVHDSALVPKSRADEALAIIESVYHEAGLQAKLKVSSSA